MSAKPILSVPPRTSAALPSSDSATVPEVRLVNVFDPRLIVLGGRFARLAPYVGASIEAELDRRALAAPRTLVRVVPAMLGEDAPLLGAAERAIEPLLADPAAWLGPRSALAALESA